MPRFCLLVNLSSHVRPSQIFVTSSLPSLTLDILSRAYSRIPHRQVTYYLDLELLQAPDQHLHSHSSLIMAVILRERSDSTRLVSMVNLIIRVLQIAFSATVIGIYVTQINNLVWYHIRGKLVRSD